MQINRYTDYAYRVLLYLGVNQQGRVRVTMAEISNYYAISHEHLRKVVHQLAKLEYIRTYSGKKGGMELNKELEDCNLGQIFIEFEGVSSLIDCQKTACPLSPSCSLNYVINTAHQSFIKELKKHSLANLLQNKKMVELLLV